MYAGNMISKLWKHVAKLSGDPVMFVIYYQSFELLTSDHVGLIHVGVGCQGEDHTVVYCVL